MARRRMSLPQHNLRRVNEKLNLHSTHSSNLRLLLSLCFWPSRRDNRSIGPSVRRFVSNSRNNNNDNNGNKNESIRFSQPTSTRMRPALVLRPDSVSNQFSVVPSLNLERNVELFLFECCNNIAAKKTNLHCHAIRTFQIRARARVHMHAHTCAQVFPWRKKREIVFHRFAQTDSASAPLTARLVLSLWCQLQQFSTNDINTK